MKKDVEIFVDAYFNGNNGKSFLVTEIMKLYLSTEQDAVKLGCLELLYKMKGYGNDKAGLARALLFN